MVVFVGRCGPRRPSVHTIPTLQSYNMVDVASFFVLVAVELLSICRVKHISKTA
jgi:hypothetical protein